MSDRENMASSIINHLTFLNGYVLFLDIEKSEFLLAKFSINTNHRRSCIDMTINDCLLFFCHFKKYICISFMCLLIPFPTDAANLSNSTSFLDGNLLDKQQCTVFPFKADIGCFEPREGFRSGTQVISLATGADYGLLILGAEEQHHFFLMSASYGQIIGDVQGLGRFYSGNWELRAELFGGIQFNSETVSLIGVTPHLRYNFITGTNLVPYVDIGAGITLTNIGAPDLGGPFEFNEQAIVGANYFMKDHLAINFYSQYMHVSSARIYHPNNGVNTIGCFGGIQWYF